jgi:hypothetical protein
MQATQVHKTHRPRELRVAPYEAPALLAVAGIILLATGQATGFAWVLFIGAAWLIAVTVEARGQSLRISDPTPRHRTNAATARRQPTSASRRRGGPLHGQQAPPERDPGHSGDVQRGARTALGASQGLTMPRRLSLRAP